MQGLLRSLINQVADFDTCPYDTKNYWSYQKQRNTAESVDMCKLSLVRGAYNVHNEFEGGFKHT
jgi:hypothetical protein